MKRILLITILLVCVTIVIAGYPDQEQQKAEMVSLNYTKIIHDWKLTDYNPGRIDFGDILNQVNADSIIWFMQQLQDFTTRFSGAPNRFAVANWIKDQFLRFGITDAHTELFYAETLDQYNAVATIPGSIDADKYIIIGGHHDSITFGSDPMVSAPGADDNASGAAAVLEIARVMNANNYQPECTIKFITFAFEELGGYGSQFDVQNNIQSGEDIKFVIIYDMIANCTASPGNWIMELIPYEGSEGYTDLAFNLTDSLTTLIPVISNDLNSNQSDSYFYWQGGFPVIMYHESEFSPYYHSVNDVVANCNPQYVKEVVKASAAAAIAIDQMPSPVDSVHVAEPGTGNTLLVNWSNLNLEPDVVLYKVYAKLASQPNPVQYTTTATTFVVPNLVSDSLYSIGVAAVDGDSNEGLTNYVTFTPHLVPLVPTGLAEAPLMHAVMLTWLPNTELDIAGYRLYRSISPNGPFNLINSDLFITTSYTDNNVQDAVYYYYKLTAVDTENHESLPSEIIRSRAVTLNQGILVIDETRNNTGNTVFAPNDATSDQFFDNVLHNFTRAQFDTETDGILKLADIGIYSSILWHGNDFGSMSYPYLVREEIRKYVQMGGQILVSSYKPTLAFGINDAYPNTFETGDFMFDTFGIQNTAYNNQARFKYASPQNSGFPALTVDTLKTLAPLNGHLYMIESIAANDTALNIYYYGSDYSDSTNQGSLNGMPVGVYYQPGLGKTILLSFPLFNMYESDVENLMNYVFHDLFAEQVGIEDNELTPIADVMTFSAYPNPFKNSVNIKIKQANYNLPLNVSIFNIRGQKVKTVFSDLFKNTHQSIKWDGKDNDGSSVASGLYIIKASSGEQTFSKKICFLK